MSQRYKCRYTYLQCISHPTLVTFYKYTMNLYMYVSIHIRKEQSHPIFLFHFITIINFLITPHRKTRRREGSTRRKKIIIMKKKSLCLYSTRLLCTYIKHLLWYVQKCMHTYIEVFM